MCIYNNRTEQNAELYCKIVFKKSIWYPTKTLYLNEIFYSKSLYILTLCNFIHNNLKYNNTIKHCGNMRGLGNDIFLYVTKSNDSLRLRFASYLGHKYQ